MFSEVCVSHAVQSSAVRWPVPNLIECILVSLDIQLYYYDNRSQITGHKFAS